MLFFIAIVCSYIVTYSKFDLILKLGEREFLSTAKYQDYYEHNISSSSSSSESKQGINFFIWILNSEFYFRK